MSEPSSPSVTLIAPSELSKWTERIGRGTFGSVYKCLWQNREVAIKVFDNSNHDVKILQKEVAQLAQCQHKNIVKLFGAWWPTSRQPVTSGAAVLELNTPYYVMEYADSGTVYDVVYDVNRSNVNYSIGLAFSWLLQIAKAIEYLHSHSPRPIIHRDLKSMNLLLFDQGRTLKVCDFGTVRMQSTTMTESKGTATWMAPEIHSNRGYTEKVDCYSFGIILWELLARDRPFKNMNAISIMFGVQQGNLRPPVFIDCPPTLQSLINGCLNYEHTNRYSMKVLVEILEIIAPSLPGFDEGLIYPPDCIMSPVQQSEDASVSQVQIIEDPTPAPQIRVTNQPQLIQTLGTASSGSHRSPPEDDIRDVLEAELDPLLRPVSPIPGNADSEEIHRSHLQLLEQYLTKQMDLVRLTQRERDLELELSKFLTEDEIKEAVDIKCKILAIEEELSKANQVLSPRGDSSLSHSDRSVC